MSISRCEVGNSNSCKLLKFIHYGIGREMWEVLNLPSEGKGHTFESCRVRQNSTIPE